MNPGFTRHEYECISDAGAGRDYCLGGDLDLCSGVMSVKPEQELGRKGDMPDMPILVDIVLRADSEEKPGGDGAR